MDLVKDLGKDAAKGIGQNIATQGIKSHFGAQDGFSFEDAVKAGAKPLVEFEDDGWGVDGAGDKVKDVGKVGTGAYHVAQGAGQMAQGDFAEGGKKIWEGQQEQPPRASRASTTSPQGQGAGGRGRRTTVTAAPPTAVVRGRASGVRLSSSSEGGSGSSSSVRRRLRRSASSATSASGDAGRGSRTPFPTPRPPTAARTRPQRVRSAFG